MPIQVKCSCGRAFSVPDPYAGKVGKCSACGKSVTVPRPAAASDDGLLKLEAASPSPQSGPTCHAHPQRLARGACSECGKFLCQPCLCTVDGTSYCQSCLAGSAAFRGRGSEERGEGLVTKSYKAYFNADTPLAAVRSARLTVMNGWFLWAFMVGMCFFFIYLQPLAVHYTRSAGLAIALGLLQFVVMGFLECAFVACIRDALFQKEFGFARFFHYGQRYFIQYFLCYLAYYGVMIVAFVAFFADLLTSSSSGKVVVFKLLTAIGGIFMLTVFFFYARLIVVLEGTSAFAAVRKGVAFGLQYPWKVLLLGLLSILALLFCFVSIRQGGCFVLFLPDWAAPMIRNLFVFLTLGFQIAAAQLLYLSLLPDEESFRMVLPPEDIPEPTGPAGAKVSAGVFFAVLALGYWTYHLSYEPGEFGIPRSFATTTTTNRFGEKIVKAIRPKADLHWKVDLGGPVFVAPIAAGDDVIVFAKDTVQRRKGSDGSLLWKGTIPGRPVGTAVSDGARAYVTCGVPGPATAESPFGTATQALVAVDLKSGGVAWKVELPKACETEPSPEVAGDLVVVPSAYQLHAFACADGKPAWAAGDAARYVLAGPARAGDDGIYYTTKDMQIHVVGQADGKEIRAISSPQLSVYRKPVLTSDALYTTAANEVVCLDRKTGSKLWSHIVGYQELNSREMRLEVVAGRPVYHYADGLVALDPAKKDVAWILEPQEAGDEADPTGQGLRHEQFEPDGFAVVPGGLVLLANGAEVVARVDMKEGKRSGMLDVPVEPPKQMSDEGEDEGGVDLRWMDAGAPTDPLVLGNSVVFALRGKLYSIELPKL